MPDVKRVMIIGLDCAEPSLVLGRYRDQLPTLSALADAGAVLAADPAEAVRGADVVVTAAGQTSLEAVATGAATIAVPMVGNQRRNAEALRAARAAGRGGSRYAHIGTVASSKSSAALANVSVQPSCSNAMSSAPPPTIMPTR